MRAMAIGLVIIALTGCAKLPDRPIQIRTDPYNLRVCPANRGITGTMVTDDTWGLGLQIGGDFHGVIWPFLYAARRENGVVLLISDSGAIVAREGDRLHLGATTGDDGVVVIYCGQIQVLT